MKIAVCCIIKLENNYIREWCEHYKHIGVDDIYIYDNNDIDGEKPNDILKDLSYVHITDVRGKQGYQVDAYNDCISKHQNDYDYICFFDADEFLTFTIDNTIQEYLSRECFKNATCIQPSICDYDDNNLLGNENNCDRSLMKRFTHRNDRKENPMCKSILCMNNGSVKMISSNAGHVSNGIITNGAGNKKTSKVDSENYAPANYSLCMLRHYRKTIIEFIETKYKKSWADSTYLTIASPQFDWYWKYARSKKTPAKLQIIDTFLKTGKIDYTIKND